jgi:hypothetical protein
MRFLPPNISHIQAAHIFEISCVIKNAQKNSTFSKKKLDIDTVCGYNTAQIAI